MRYQDILKFEKKYKDINFDDLFLQNKKNDDLIEYFWNHEKEVSQTTVLLYLVLEIKDADLDEKTKSILLRKLAGYFLEPLDKGFVHAINSTLKIASQSKEKIDKDDEFSYVIRFFNLGA